MAPSYPPTHDAVVTTGKRLPLAIREVDTAVPEPGEVVVRVEWTASSPLDLHQADGGIITSPPFTILGCSFAGTVVATGEDDPTATKPNSAPVQLGDQVFGFAWEKQKQMGFQTYVTVPRRLVGRIPPNLTVQQAVTAPANLVCAIHTITQDLRLELPWPKPEGWTPKEENHPILIWGAASSVGLFAIQVLRHWGYKNVLAVASSKHHEELAALGARKSFDYKDTGVTDQISAHAGPIYRIIDCIGQLEGTLRPLSKIAVKGTIVAVMLPVILRDATEEVGSEVDLDPASIRKVQWADGVGTIGVRTFFFEKNELLKWHLEPDIVPALLESGVVKPNRARIVEGKTLLERAQNALNLLRQRAPSGERLVWRVAE
ncbi:hypothetical protein ACRE_022920 [Hapsidospora chrysogenum ATCC 11550]|uniref:Enoyl reductase (ER) domain-containing protein n=1 Tax=Hapsidospora chrysogenum (strain ATCC 11550 / CBS 779.69 / DSM 880 / IAM 14645 / JCM 23072 / IMI 49137) TaxID=857340 RepID=A0A086TBZ3_HAPC1|nr:hypothetical protein ACRE_022920 [Hapsidospora chrysogenum ATCC 11550]